MQSASVNHHTIEVRHVAHATNQTSGADHKTGDVSHPNPKRPETNPAYNLLPR